MDPTNRNTALASAMAELANEGSLGREGGLSAERPVLIDRFLEDAVEVDVDAIRDATGEVLIGGVMEHVEEAGVHSGDSPARAAPSLSATVIEVIEAYTRAIAAALDVRGLINVQYAEGRPGVRARGEPAGEPYGPVRGEGDRGAAREVATRVMVGATLAELREEGLLRPPTASKHTSVKEAVLPFNRFPGVDTVLGPEMRSTGEVMGIDRTFGLAFAKSQISAGNPLPSSGTIFLSLADRDKAAGLEAARRFVELGFSLAATAGTAAHLEANRVPVATVVAKVGEGIGQDAVDLISSGKVDLVVNSPRGRGARADGRTSAAANVHRVPCLTTVAAALAARTA
jgi:carbamoyl-phosphate synthase large subunit